MARRTTWIDNLSSFVVAPGGGQQSQSLLQGVAPEDTRGTTVVRVLYDLQLHSTSVAGAWGVQALDLAFGVTSQEAFAAGVFPDPNADERPVGGWMFRTRCVIAQNGAGAPILTSCKGDLRSGRKLDAGEVYVVANNSDLDGTAFTVRVTGIIRLLLMLP